MTDTPTPVVAPKDVTPTEVNAFIAFLQNLINNGQIRQDLNPKTAPFWALVGSVVAIVLAWINPGSDLNEPIQGVITGLGGLVVLYFTHQTATKVSVSALNKLIASFSTTHQGIIAKSFTPTPLNPSPAGQVGSEGYYSPGQPNGSVLAPGAVVVVPGYSGGASGRGNVPDTQNNEGNVETYGNLTINVQSGAWPSPNAEPYNPLNPTQPLPNQSGDNSNEGTGGPVISPTQGGLGVGGSVEAPGGYVAPTPSKANPDEENPSIFVAKDVAPTHKRSFKARKETDVSDKK